MEKLQMKSSSAINLYKHRLLDWLVESLPQQIIFYFGDRIENWLTFPPFYPIYNSVVLDAPWADWHNETFWNCQYNSFKNWQSLKESVQIELIFNPILFYQNIMFNLSWSVVFGAIENLKYIRRGLKF